MNVEDLQVYQESFALSVSLYPITRNWKDFWLRDQVMRSSSSVCANLAEMSGHHTDEMYLHKLTICRGEAKEIIFWLKYCNAIGIPIPNELSDKADKVARMLYNLKESVGNQTDARRPSPGARR